MKNVFITLVPISIISGDNIFNYPLNKLAYQVIDHYHEVLESYKNVITNFEEQKNVAYPVSRLKIWSQPTANLDLFPIIGYKWSSRERSFAWPASRQADKFIENGAADEVTKQ